MHIAVVTKNMQAGGAERVISRLLHSWNEKGVQLSLISIDPREMFYPVPQQTACYGMDDFSGNALKVKLKKYSQLRKYIKKIKPDVVLSMPEEIGIYVTLALLGSRVPVVVSERNNPWVMPYKKISRILRRVAYPFAKGLIFQTPQAASFFSRGQQKKGIVLPNPLDVSRLPQPETREREKTVCGAGRLEQQKNFPLLIRAFGRFQQKHPQYKLVIYGEGTQRQQLEALAEQTLPKGSWSFPGRVDDLPQRIERSEVFVLSSDYEGMPNVLIEAMAVGTPAISADCAPGGAAYLIESMENGILVPVGDEEAMAQSLCFLVENPEAAADMARKAMKVREELDAGKIADRWLAYLEKCVRA